MYTGIITDIGSVRAVDNRGDTRFEIATSWDTSDIEIGASVACSGPCFTVTEKGAGWFAFTASAETLSLTTLGGWSVGRRVNLERSLRLGDELGGHLVSGHVDGIAHIFDRREEGDSLRFTISAPSDLMRFVARKGSVALDGVALTVNEVSVDSFGVNIIPHTQQATTFGAAGVGDAVNMEIDMLARYVARLVEKG